MRGYAQDIEPAYGTPALFERQVVGVVCASNFPDPDLIREVLRKGQAHDQNTVWIARDQDRVARSALDSMDIEYLRVGLQPYWQGEGYDLRRSMREQEILRCCSMVVLFTTPETGTLGPFLGTYAGNVKVIERGKKKARKRQGRKPAHV